MIPGIELAACGPLAIPIDVMTHVVHVESSGNPFAIGVVGGRLLRQPRNLAEAAATVRMLEANGHNYSIGLAQVNRVNFQRFGLDTPEKGFDVCNNVAAGASILSECLQRNDGRWGDAFSCYYSGNARTGYAHGYVQKVFSAMATTHDQRSAGIAIPLAGAMTASRAAVPSSQSETAWDAVYAARITAPGAVRAQPVQRTQSAAREQGLTDDASVVMVAAASDVPPVPAPPRHAESPVASGDEFGDASARPPRPMATPEARLIEEMKTLAAARDVDGGETAVDAVPEIHDTSVKNQQTSNSPPEDAARVF